MLDKTKHKQQVRTIFKVQGKKLYKLALNLVSSTLNSYLRKLLASAPIKLKKN